MKWKFGIIFLLILSSCGRNSDIKVQFVNQSDYNIEQLIFSLTHQTDTISLKQKTESDLFYFRYDMPWANLFSDPMLNLWLKKYSDSTQTYTSNTGRVVGRSQLSRSKVNRILILYNSTNNVFYYELDK